MHILRADQGHNVLLYSGIHLTGKLDELLRIFLIRREQLSCLGIIGGFQNVVFFFFRRSLLRSKVPSLFIVIPKSSSSSACFLLSVLSCLT